MERMNDMIYKKEFLVDDETFAISEADIHIAFGVDANFALGMGVCMTSVILNNPAQKIVFHVFTDKLNEEDLKRLKLLKAHEKIKVILYYIAVEIFQDFPTSVDWTYATYFRFVMGKALSGTVDRVLYLDADILCVGALRELADIDMEGYTVIAVSDLMDIFQGRLESLSIKNGKYFNAGVLYIDIKRWCEERISEMAMQMMRENPGKFKSLDQDVLNILLDGKAYFADRRWNYLYSIMNMKHITPAGTGLVHFTGDKPWQKWSEHNPMADVYRTYIAKSPWRDVPLMRPRTYKDMRKMARSHAKQKNYIAAGQWFTKYLLSRHKKSRK